MKSILSHPFAYNFLQNLLSEKKSHGLLIEKYVKPDKKDHILDLGCGPGRLIDSLPNGIQYTGIDISTDYIEDAKRRYGNKYNFICSNILDIDFSNVGTFDKVIARGFFHHLDDKTILVLSEQGLVYIIQFSRYIFELKKNYNVNIIFKTHKNIKKMLAL